MGDGLSLIRLITVSRVRWQHLDTAGPDGHFANRLQISRRIVDAEPLDIGVRRLRYKYEVAPSLSPVRQSP
jgi:hypothetical protein